MMARAKQTGKLAELMKSLKGVVVDEDWDRIIGSAITVFAREVQDMKLAERYVSMIVSDENRIDALIIAGKLKAAYLQAVNINKAAYIERIRNEAQRTNQDQIVRLCDQYLHAAT